jgi:hypothetical protein
LKNSFRKNKYNAVKTVIDGTKYDSRKEARRGEELKMLEKAGVISALRFQVPFELQPSFERDGKTIRAINYIADAVYYEKGRMIVEDTKSPATAAKAEYRIKKKLFMFKYPEYVFRENI